MQEREEKLEFLSDVIRKRREVLGWSQNRLAREASMEPSTISRIERNLIVTPQPDKLRRLAEVLSLSQIELMQLAGHLTVSPAPERWRERLRAEFGLSDTALEEIAAIIARDRQRQPEASNKKERRE